MSIWWIRRDLRLSDNAALQAALSGGRGLIPLFILDPHPLQFVAAKRQAFLITGLRQLDVDLRARGSRLIVRQGNPADILMAILAETNAPAVFAEEGYSPYARRRDAEIAVRLPLRLTSGRTVHHPADLVKRDGSPYTIFTPFMRLWKTLPALAPNDLLPAPASLPPVPESLLSCELPDANPPADFPPGEAEAERRLCTFASGSAAPICAYSDGRNRLDRAGTSALSPYLRFGVISARQAVVAARSTLRAANNPASSDGAETWLNELIWREFYQTILFHFPNVLQEAFRAGLRAIAWENSSDDFAAWCEGRTGYPIVDAAMRQLVQTGWMHNRARMIVASFLVKDLLIDWQWGERFFMEHLIDGDAAANNGGWQWTAGVGADAAPYFRIFNPVLQAQKFDPAGVYVRRWLPELAGVPDKYIHAPWTMPDSIQRAANCIIGNDYPAPIIDRKMTRPRTLAAYQQAAADNSR
jgi:deoxyribodipyrimidine photo-lyase